MIFRTPARHINHRNSSSAVERHIPRLIGVSALLVLITSFQIVAQTSAQVYPPFTQPLWVTVNALAQGNYPGGNEMFTVFAVNSAPKAENNETIYNMTLTAPFASNFGPGLPATIRPGQSILVTIYLPIPANFTQSSFTADLVVHASIWNGTGNQPFKLTGSAPVNVFALPSQVSSQTTTATTGQTGGISTTLFAVGVAVPSLIAIVVLALLIQARAKPKPV